MNFPRLTKKYIKGVGMVEIKPYLTTNEINNILYAIKQASTDYAMRKTMMYTLVMSTCTNIKEFQEEEVDIETSDKFYINGIFERIVKYIKGFDTLINGFEQLSTVDVYSQFEEAIEGFTKQFKDINLDESMKKFETELGKLQEVQKEKEMILNGK
jgi:cell fate (sporulation/competence/biofilm development) regulator YmcA (YheA/YmcA/DUF963 family)